MRRREREPASTMGQRYRHGRVHTARANLIASRLGSHLASGSAGDSEESQECSPERNFRALGELEPLMWGRPTEIAAVDDDPGLANQVAVLAAEAIGGNDARTTEANRKRPKSLIRYALHSRRGRRRPTAVRDPI